MKKLLKSILSVFCLVALILAGGENPDGSCCFPWSLTWLAAAFLAGVALRLVFSKEATK